MSAGPSLYRRHRPRTFADVVGQEHVVRTLRNAVERGQVHHAYLFVGSRGTGKTSMAKILASCLNCESGPTVAPCGRCASCLAIQNASSLDVIEMDAASNNSVDDIRDLREKVGFAPVSGRHKVYILDEAHMLSTAAWNAFLKTLEEPPPHTVFVLATTEAQKVLPTVVDRCHRFDFQRPGAEQVAVVLRRVAAAEGLDIAAEALSQIARSATGSFRDALGTLEQLVTYAGERIALDDVLAVLGVVGGELLFEAFDAIAAGDGRAALLLAARIVASGRDPGIAFRDLEAHARELLAVQVLGEVPPELRLTPEHDERLGEQAGRLTSDQVVRLLDLLAAGLSAMADGADPRIQLELALLKAAAPEVDPGLTALLARLARLEAGGVAGAPARPAAAAPSPSDSPSLGPSGSAPPSPSPEDPAASPPEPAGPPGPAPVAGAPAPTAVPPVTRADQPVASAPGPAAEPHSDASSAAPPTSASSSGSPIEAGPAVEQSAAPPMPDPPAAPAAEPRPPPAPPADLDGVRALWPAVVQAVAESNTMVAAALAESRPSALVDDRLTVAFPVAQAFHKRLVERNVNCAQAAAALRAVTGRPLRLVFELSADLEPIGSAGEPADPEELVRRFVAEFDAQEILDEE